MICMLPICLAMCICYATELQKVILVPLKRD